jgi:hypothetical protein
MPKNIFFYYATKIIIFLINSTQSIIISTICLINFSRIGETSQDYYYYSYKTKSNYDQAFNNVYLWTLENNKELILTITRVYYIKKYFLKVLIYRLKIQKKITRKYLINGAEIIKS